MSRILTISSSEYRRDLAIVTNDEADAKAAAKARLVKDSNGTVLENGDNVSVIKDLKLKGSSQVVKVGTKVRNIRLVDGDHNIDYKIDGIGQMGLKSEFVRKST